MHAPAPIPKHRVWWQRLERSGYLLGAIFLHVVVFIMVATIVIWKIPPKLEDPTFQPSGSIKVPPPVPQKPANEGSAAANPAEEPQALVVPPITPPSVIISPSNSDLVLNATNTKNALANIPLPKTGSGIGTGGGSSGNGPGTDANPFGGGPATVNKLEGHLYDLKQTSDGQPTNMTPIRYHQTLSEFVDENWDESVLAPYYKGLTPLYTSQILVPSMDADAGPKAFGLEKQVQPKMWIVWYKGKVSPTVSGTYRFVGFCDDILLVRLDGSTVLDGSIRSVTNKVTHNAPWPTKWEGGLDDPGRRLREGVEVQATKGQPLDIDILIGEEPGGLFTASLFIMNVDKKYALDDLGQPILPLFQLGDFKPDLTGSHAPVSTTPDPWEGTSQ